MITMAAYDGKVEFSIDGQDLGIAFDNPKLRGSQIYPVVILNGDNPDSESDPDSLDSDDARKRESS